MAAITKVAVAQVAPAFMDVAATLARLREVAREASARGANMLLFPEAFVPGYPYWIWTMLPHEQIPFTCELHANSLNVPGPETALIGGLARELGLVIIVGINERDRDRYGTLYNTNLIFGPDGSLLGKHRKLVPTFAEKLIWGAGDGSSYRVYETGWGRIGTLACGENTNPLARFALLAQGEQIHFANYPAFPFSSWYEEAEAIRIRAQGHAFEGKLFVACSTSLFDSATLTHLGGGRKLARMFSGSNYALSGIFGPDGLPICDLLIDEEGICYADCNLDSLVPAKMMHDVTGHYNDFGALSLNLDQRPHVPIHFVPAKGSLESEVAGGEMAPHVAPEASGAASPQLRR